MMPPTSPCAPPTAAGLMRRDLVTVHDAVPLQVALRLLARSAADVAAVVDDSGRCVGMLRVDDEVRRAAEAAPACPPTCGYQRRHPLPDRTEVVVCTLPEGACPLQRECAGVSGRVCLMPNTVLSDWQQVPDMGTGPTVGQFTTPASDVSPG
jgi:CBS domain